MDPHEEWLYYQSLIEERKMRRRLIDAFDRIRRHVRDEPDKAPTEQLEVISPRRSSTFAEYMRTHRKAFIGGAATALVIAVGGEIIRRIRGRP